MKKETTKPESPYWWTHSYENGKWVLVEFWDYLRKQFKDD